LDGKLSQFQVAEEAEIVSRRQAFEDVQSFGTRYPPADAIGYISAEDFYQPLPLHSNLTGDAQRYPTLDQSEMAHGNKPGREANLEDAGNVTVTAVDWNSGSDPMTSWLNQSAIPAVDHGFQEVLEESKHRQAIFKKEQHDLEHLQKIHAAAVVALPPGNLSSEFDGGLLNSGAWAHYRKILDKYPTIPRFLALRLAEANVSRDNRLRQVRHTMTNNIEKDLCSGKTSDPKVDDDGDSNSFQCLYYGCTRWFVITDQRVHMCADHDGMDLSPEGILSNTLCCDREHVDDQETMNPDKVDNTDTRLDESLDPNAACHGTDNRLLADNVPGPVCTPGLPDLAQSQLERFSIDAVKAFLREHVPNDRIESLPLGIAAAASALDAENSTPATPDMITIDSLVVGKAAATSALDAENFTPATRDVKTINLCPYPGCSKISRRKCGLRKHYKRHTLPWACTFDTCHKPFGSKNDWKRHELRQHEQQESWRCEEICDNVSGESVPSSGDDACKRLFHTKKLYLMHLQRSHRITEYEVTAKLCRTQRIGTKDEGRYWCGFCNKIVIKRQIGVGERYDHISDHFVREGRNIEQWKPLNGRPVPSTEERLYGSQGRRSPSVVSHGSSRNSSLRGDEDFETGYQRPSFSSESSCQPGSYDIEHLPPSLPPPPKQHSENSKEVYDCDLCCRKVSINRNRDWQ
jgi:hypothetical protein